MTSADVDLKSDQSNRIRFAHSPLKAVLFTLISAGFTWVCWRFIPEEEPIRIFFVGFTLLFVLLGILGIFWRMELDIDLGSRQVRTRRGMWPVTKTGYRPLDEADGVWLTLEYRSSGSKRKRNVPWWFVSLRFPAEKKGMRIAACTSEIDAYQKWEYYARRLQLNAVDATTDQPQRKAWQELDAKLAAQPAENEPRHSPAPPAGSTIRLTWNRGREEILLPALGFNKGLVFLLLFGGVFVAMGAGALLAKMGVLDMQVQGSETALNIVPPIFILVGLGIIWLGAKGSYSEMIIGVDNGELFTENRVFGRRSGRNAIALADIESVSVAGDVRSRHRTGGYIKVGNVSIGRRRYRARDDEIVVRSDRKILRFGGSLTEAERAWLAEACYYATLRGHLP